MPTGITISAKLNEYRLQGVVDFLGLGAPKAYALLYASVRPNSGDAPGASPLAKLEFAEGIGTIATGLLSVAPGPTAQVLLTGEALWARVFNGNDEFGWDCDVSATGGAGQIQIPSTTLYSGGDCMITGGVWG